MREKLTYVSVIIPLYNHEEYITQTLNSVLLQECEQIDIELIIINDGSNDQSALVAKQWLTANWYGKKSLLITTVNNGVSAALNLGIEKSHGKYLVLLASDDLLLNGHIKNKVQMFVDYHCDAIVNDGLLLNDTVHNKSIIFEYYNGHESVYRDRRLLGPEILSNWSIPGSCLMIKRDVAVEVGKFSEGLLIEDWDFFSRLLLKHDTLFVKDQITGYRIHDSNNHLEVSSSSIASSIFIAIKALFYRPMSIRRSKCILRYILGLSYLYISLFYKRKSKN